MRCAGQLRAVAYTDSSWGGAMRSAGLPAIAAPSRHASSANGNASATRWNMNQRAPPPASAAPATSSTNVESTELTSATRNVRSARPLKCMRLHGLIASASSAMIAAAAIWPAAGRPSANGFGAWERDVIVGAGSELIIEKILHLADAEEYDRERRADEEQRHGRGHEETDAAAPTGRRLAPAFTLCQPSVSHGPEPSNFTETQRKRDFMIRPGLQPGAREPRVS